MAQGGHTVWETQVPFLVRFKTKANQTGQMPAKRFTPVL